MTTASTTATTSSDNIELAAGVKRWKKIRIEKKNAAKRRTVAKEGHEKKEY